MLQRARRVVDRARERIRAAAEHDPHARPDGTILVLEDGSRAVVDHVEEPHPGDSHPVTSAPVRDPAPLAPGSPHPDAPDVDVPGGVSGPRPRSPWSPSDRSGR